MVFARYCALFLSLLAPIQADQEVYRLSVQDQMARPFVALLKETTEEYTRDELRSFRSSLEKERDQQIEACRKLEESWRDQLNSARGELKKLNNSSSRDTPWMDSRRTGLHTQIAALEQAIRNKQMEREQVILPAFEIKLAKLFLIERWPQRQREIARRIEHGLARERKHGDIEDIGYRKLAGDPKQDTAIGEQAVRQMASGGLMPREVRDGGVQEYVRLLAARMTANSDLKTPLHVTVLDTSEVNAIALPGGFLFVTSGLILAAGSEGELADVISREIAHIAARHGSRASKHSTVSRIFLPAAQVTTGFFTGGVANRGAYYGINYGVQSLGALVDRALTGASEEYQREADQLGVQYAWKAGFDPTGFIAFLDSIAKDPRHSGFANFFHTKPLLGERLADAFTEIEYLPAGQPYAADSAEFEKAKDSLVRTGRTRG